MSFNPIESIKQSLKAMEYEKIKAKCRKSGHMPVPTISKDNLIGIYCIACGREVNE